MTTMMNGELSSDRRDALRWIAEREPVGLFPGKPSLNVVRGLHADGFLDAIRPSRPIGNVTYRLNAAGHSAMLLRLPIVMCPETVRSLWEGRKTQTRRITYASAGPGTIWLKLRPGDLLWVREAFGGPVLNVGPGGQLVDSVVYPATTDKSCRDHKGHPIRIQSGRYMPRTFSRLTLRITAKPRIEPVQKISPADVRAEGCETRDDFVRLWVSLHKPEAWSQNPDVAVISFVALRTNIDAL